MMRFQYSAAVFVLLLDVGFAAPAFAQSKYQGTFVNGVAVYRDSESGTLKRVPGARLFLVNGAFHGPISRLPPKLDEDYTSSRHNGFRPEDEGLFQLFTPSDVRIVSIVYRRLSSNMSGSKLKPYFSKKPSGSASKPFFSTVAVPRQIGSGKRRVAKLQLEMWPVDRPISDARTLQRVVTGILLAHTVMQPVDKKDNADISIRNELESELKQVADLLPANEDRRRTLLAQAYKAIAAFAAKNRIKSFEFVPKPNDKSWTPSRARLEKTRAEWKRFRGEAASGKFPR